MYIQDPTLARIFHEKETEFIENTEPEILAAFKTILESDNFKADRAVIRAAALERYKSFSIISARCTKKNMRKRPGTPMLTIAPGAKMYSIATIKLC